MRVPSVRVLTGICLALALIGLPAAVHAQTGSRPGGAGAEAGPAALSNGAAAAEAGAVAAIVNDVVVSNYDVDQRMELLAFQRDFDLSAEARRQLRPQVLNQLIDEILQLQEARKREVEIEEKEVEQALGEFAKRRNTDLPGLIKQLSDAGIDLLTLRTQIRAEIGWQRLIGRRLANRVNVTDDEVNQTLSRIEESARRPQFEVLEIVLYFDSEEQKRSVLQFGDRIVSEIRLGAPFRGVAQQFSQSPSAAQGGAIGWVQEGELAAPVDAALRRMRPGQISDPIETEEAIYIVALADRREPAAPEGAGNADGAAAEAPAAPANPAAVPLAQITIRVRSEDAVRGAVQQLVRIRDQAQSCAEVAELARAAGFEYQSLGTVRFADMAEPVRAALQQAGAGGLMPPVQASDGSIVSFIRCDQRIIRYEAFQMPTREQIEDRIFMSKLDNQARRYLRDLRRDANIEYR